MIRRRAAGVLLHVSSLPSEFGIGDLGPQAYKWVDFLAEAGQSLWQILPLNPTVAGAGHSPYLSTSAFAGDPLLISPALLREEGLLEEGDLHGLPELSDDRISYGEVVPAKRKLMELSFARFTADATSAHGALRARFDRFCELNAKWLDDFALFAALRRRYDDSRWQDWPEPLRDRASSDLDDARRDLRDEIELQRFSQFIFDEQWAALKRYAGDRGVRMVGDLPFYVGGDSADVWAHASLFKLDSAKLPTVVAGVPPDYFSETGQLWGNPVYEWRRHADTGYAWWINRLRRCLELFDVLRIDHFRGFAGSWEVPAGDETAVGGRWVEGPGSAFFETLLKYRPFAPLIAEDLGLITADVRELIDRYQFPGMRVLHFGFDGDPADNPHMPHNHERNAIIYTGTHDNNTTKGWFENDATPEQKERMREYLGGVPSESGIHWDLVRVAMSSVCGWAIVPMQDILGLDGTARMNRPSNSDGNWRWRLLPGAATQELARKLGRLARTYGRA